MLSGVVWGGDRNRTNGQCENRIPPKCLQSVCVCVYIYVRVSLLLAILSTSITMLEDKNIISFSEFSTEI